MTSEEVKQLIQPPEFIVLCVGKDGKMHKSPCLFQRKGETKKALIARTKALEAALNNDSHLA